MSRLQRLAALVLLCSPALAAASGGDGFTLTGRLADAGGAPIAAGDHAATFTLHDALTGGTALCRVAGTVRVGASGAFSKLVSGPCADDAARTVASVVKSRAALWVGVAVDGGAELSPRLAVSAAPYALRADAVVGHVQAGNASICDASTAGQIRWTGTAFQGCDGVRWVGFAPACQDGSLQSCAAPSCRALRDAGRPSATYWVDPDADGNPANAFQVYCDQSTDGGGWAVLIKADLQSEALTTGAVSSPGSSDHKQTDARINALIAASTDPFNVRVQCGGYVAKAAVKSGWASNGPITTCTGSDSNDGYCGANYCDPYYCGFTVRTTNSADRIVTMLSSQYGPNSPPCRVHDRGDYAILYMTR